MRPVATIHQLVAAQEVAFLPALHAHLLHKCLLAAFYNRCDEFVSFYRDNPDEAEVNFGISIGTTENTEQLQPLEVEGVNIDIASLIEQRRES